MKRWVLSGLAGAAVAMALGAWLMPVGVPPAAALAEPLRPARPLPAADTAPAAAAVAPRPAPAASTAPAAPAAVPGQAGLSPQEAQVLMQVMAERGDPRSPALGGLAPRVAATPAQRADPEQYAAFEERHSRSLIQAYVAGVQQIPAIRERIEQAAQSGERSTQEIEEARAALEQLEMLRAKLQREAPDLLP